MSVTANCPVCGRGYHPSVWFKTNPRTWRLGVRQDPRRRFLVLGDVTDPAELPEGVFEVMSRRLVDGLIDWIFHKRIDLGWFLRKLGHRIQLGWFAGRKVVHIWADMQDVRPVRHEVEHSFSFRRYVAPAQTPVSEVTHRFKFGGR